MNKEQLRELLIGQHQYKESQVGGIIEKIERFSPNVAAAFEKWLVLGEIDGMEVEGYTVLSIMKIRQMKTVAAFLALDWLTKDPLSAKAAINEPRIQHSAAQN
jgi:hypothetical protein